MRATLGANQPLRRLLFSWAQSCIGTGAGYVALLLLTYRHLHTAWAIAAVLVADFLPAIAFGSWFGVLADPYPPRPLIIAANLVQALAFAALAIVGRTTVPIIGFALLAGIGNALLRPALRSALPVVAGKASQTAAAWYEGCRWVGITAGPVVAAGLFALPGPALPLALNAVSFVVAAVVMATVVIDRSAGDIETTRRPDKAGLRAGLAAAFAAPGIAAVIA